MKICGHNIRMPWETPTRVVEPGRTSYTPMGAPVSRAFTVVGGESGDAMRHTLAVIDSLHGDGIIPPLTARREVITDLWGQFSPGEGVLIHPAAPSAALVTAHEMGHVLDFYGFLSGRYESTHGQEMVSMMDAWRASTAYRELQTLRVVLRTPLNAPLEEQTRQSDLKKVNYLLDVSEVWARAYSQWVATSSQDPTLLRQWEAMRQDPQYSRFFFQWSESDFARIRREIDLLFKRKGWLR